MNGSVNPRYFSVQGNNSSIHYVAFFSPTASFHSFDYLQMYAPTVVFGCKLLVAVFDGVNVLELSVDKICICCFQHSK